MCVQCASLREELDELREAIGICADRDKLARIRTHYGLWRAEAEVLLRLYAVKGRVVQRWALLDGLSSSDDALHVLAVYLVHIRAAVGRESIQTIRGVGYQLTAAGMSVVGEALA